MPDPGRWFVDGQPYAQAFSTPAGWLVLSADVHADGRELHLSAFDCKPLHTRYLRAGVSASMAVRGLLLRQVWQEGYTVVVISGIRTSGRHPNRSIRYRRALW